MQNVIKKNFTILEKIHTLILICFFIAHMKEFSFLSSIRLPLGVLALALTIALAYYEDLENNSSYILSEEYKKGGIHSFFNPFSWEKEWEHHFKYFLSLMEKKKFFNPFYTMGYVLILLPTRVWTNYLFFCYGRTLVSIILTVLYFLQIYAIFNFVKVSLAFTFLTLFIGNFYLLGVKTLYDRNARFREIVADLCLDKKSQYFFLGNSFSTFSAFFSRKNIKAASLVMSGIGGFGYWLHEEQIRTEERQVALIEKKLSLKKAHGLEQYEKERAQVSKTVRPITEKVYDVIFGKNSK